jgi:hypothetical protein
MFGGILSDGSVIDTLCPEKYPPSSPRLMEDDSKMDIIKVNEITDFKRFFFIMFLPPLINV